MIKATHPDNTIRAWSLMRILNVSTLKELSDTIHMDIKCPAEKIYIPFIVGV
jgi:hypothetical protein